MALPETPATLPKQLLPFVTRSKELESANPTIAYFCKLYTVEQILNQGLHASDDSISTFAIALLDDVETFKKESSQDLLDIINDQETSQVYIINFSDGIFNNSLNQIQNKKSGKSTALGFLASVNFYELLKLWKADDKVGQDEVVKKVRYAKFHAARILKSIKKGEDPNEYDPPELNPIEPEEEETVGPSEELNNLELREDPSEEPREENKETEEKEEIKQTDELGLPTAPKTFKQPSPGPSSEPEPEQESHKQSTPDFELPSTPITKPEPPKVTTKASIPKQAQKQAPETTTSDINKWIESGEIYNKAQKHAKFAISAMNYEDKETAVKQLQNALDLLNKL